jgi:hypothetical protein
METLPFDKAMETRDLPSPVQAAKGKVTLFADYNDGRWPGQVPLYLVNQGPKEILYAGIGHLRDHLYLEAQGPNGRWERAQVVYSREGECPIREPLILRPGQYTVFLGGYPQEGTERQVRFKHSSEDWDLVSNAGPGRVTDEAILLARYDPLGIEQGDVEVVNAVLFQDAGAEYWARFHPGTPPDFARRARREGAIRRLGKLPANDSAPVLEKLYTDPKTPEEEAQNVLISLNQIAPDRATLLVKSFLGSGDSEKRSRVFRGGLRPNLDDAEIRTELLKAARNPRLPELKRTLWNLAGSGHPDVTAFLDSVENDPGYPFEARAYLRYERWRERGKGLDLRIDLDSELYVDGNQVAPPPVAMAVTIRNAGKESLSFRYEKPSDIIYLFMKDQKGSEETFLPPRRPDYGFSTPEDPEKARAVRLQPGQEHRVTLALMDYFDLPPNTSGLSVWPACRIPGLPGGPVAGSSGISIPLPQQSGGSEAK